jgi:hypothetical protein
MRDHRPCTNRRTIASRPMDVMSGVRTRLLAAARQTYEAIAPFRARERRTYRRHNQPAGAQQALLPG